MPRTIELNDEQKAMLEGRQGLARQMAMRLVLDLAAAAGATELEPISSAHLSGVSPLTGGLGLRRFLQRLTQDESATVAVPTTLNAAGCDAQRFAQMRIVAPDFLEHSQEIIGHYEQLGVRPIQSCIPYEWEGVVHPGPAAWSESNAICFGNSYCGLLTNRDSGLSALASALTGYTPRYGLLEEAARRPNLHVTVSAALDDPADFSILGDWIGKQLDPSWSLPFGPIPLIEGLADDVNHEQRKALAAAAANYGCALLYLSTDKGDIPEPSFEGHLTFDEEALAARYEALQPRLPVSLVTIGCPQASVGELRAVAQLLKDKQVRSDPATPGDAPPLWVFTSSANRAIAEKTGVAQIIEGSGALLLENTCPEVVPYDQSWVHHILTNSMKAEHYIKSGLNSIPTSVMRLADCVGLATGEKKLEIGDWRLETGDSEPHTPTPPHPSTSPRPNTATHHKPHSTLYTGQGLPSQDDFSVTGEAFVTDRPITLLGFVNRRTGVIEEPGHPAHGQSLAGKIAIFPKGTGSTVAPYVLLELYYRGMAPIAIANTDIDQQTAPACSLENIPYAYSFDADIIANIQNGDTVRLARHGERVTLKRL
ncbi:MAG: aconitase X [Chloroflexota bacterium]